MSERYNGGPAFPVDTRGSGEAEDSGTYGHQTGNTTWQFSGMTLRDYFAAKAMAGMFASQYDVNMRGHEGWRDEFGREAYRYADAMLAARQAT